MNKYASNICFELFILVFLGLILGFYGVSFHYDKLFYENVLQKTICTNLNPYQITTYTSPVKDFPVDSLTYYKIPNYNYDFGANYTCWWNPFNNLMSLSYFTTLDGTVYERSGYYSSSPIFYSNNIRTWKITMICLFSILSVLGFVRILSLIFNIIRYRQTVQYTDLNVNTSNTTNTDINTNSV
ncbi:MAG: hypothetical protein Terrestrivirus6_21 [Terrestrivirus sp.]|uniref:Uncharacterized protein n=1 Tax=Terrestrivirus sp. TaxID=2487775 RepID=A0A3G4ZNF1_9VIRU|nr:MAG: hypothetical protein Terrestrivirus6_21 [Terrestrivirus sp.]